MSLDGRTAPSCKGRFSRPSRFKRLADASSQIASTLKRSRFIQSWPKAILAAGFFCLTNYVIFQDVLRHGAPVTTDHLLSFGVLVGTFAAGHWFWPTLRQWHLGSAAGLALLFVVGTLYCVITSAGRNAEALTAKASEITAQDGPRAALERQVKDAEKARDEAKGKLEAAEDEAKGAADKATAECATGPGSLCRGKTLTALAAKGTEADKQKAYDEKTSNYYMLDARLRGMLKKEANGDLKYAAKVLGYLGLRVSDDALVDLIPFAKSLFCEFMTLVLASGAFGHRRETVLPRAETVAQDVSAAVPPSNRSTATVLTLARSGGTVPTPQAAALVLLRQHLAVHETVPQNELAELFGNVSKATVSRWCDEWEGSNIIGRTVAGRNKIVALNTANGTWRVARSGPEQFSARRIPKNPGAW